MIADEKLEQQQQMNVSKEKLLYSPPMVIVLETMREVKSGSLGISEHICGCGIGS
jgi:hypothetical protein